MPPPVPQANPSVLIDAAKSRVFLELNHQYRHPIHSDRIHALAKSGNWKQVVEAHRDAIEGRSPVTLAAQLDGAKALLTGQQIHAAEDLRRSIAAPTQA